jgi:hypothetical protein
MDVVNSDAILLISGIPVNNRKNRDPNLPTSNCDLLGYRNCPRSLDWNSERQMPNLPLREES